MLMYLSYLEYQEMGGSLDITAFEDFEFAAQGIVNRYTYNRLVNASDSQIPDAVKRVVYQLINVAENRQRVLCAYGGIVSSQSNDGVSVSYASMSPDSIYQNLGNQVGEIVKTGLSGVKDAKGHKLLFKGMYVDE